jgi:hypothetical protein
MPAPFRKITDHFPDSVQSYLGGPAGNQVYAFWAALVGVLMSAVVYNVNRESPSKEWVGWIMFYIFLAGSAIVALAGIAALVGSAVKAAYICATARDKHPYSGFPIRFVATLTGLALAGFIFARSVAPIVDDMESFLIKWPLIAALLILGFLVMFSAVIATSFLIGPMLYGIFFAILRPVLAFMSK